MTTVYKTSLELGRLNHSSKPNVPNLEDILQTVHKWIEQKMPKQVSPDEFLQEEMTKENKHIILNSHFEEMNDALYFGFELIHSDERVKTNQWITTFATKITEKNAIADIKLDVKAATPQEERRASLMATRPNLVPEILDGIGAFEMIPLITKPHIINERDVEQFADFIHSKSRKTTVVYASRMNKDGKLAINPEKLARFVGGIAHVAIPDSMFASEKLEAYMGDNICYNGATRIYWPAISEELFNTYYTIERLLRKPVFGQPQFEIEALRKLSEFTLKGKSLVTLDEIKEIKRTKTKIELKVEHNFEALAENYARENDELKIEVEKLAIQNANLGQRCDILQAQLDESKSQIIDNIVIASKAKPGSIIEAVNEIKNQYPNTIEFLSRAITDARKSRFKDVESVYNALNHLASTYLLAKQGHIQIPDLDTFFKSVSKMGYSGGQSMGTMKKFESEYFCEVAGLGKIPLDQHLKLGINNDPHQTIRIAFHYNKPRAKIYVGYMGQHQTNRSS